MVSSGTSVKFGPQPVSGGSWSWTGPNGFTATTREITVTPTATSTYTATYTNTCGAKSTQAFVVTVSGGCTPPAAGSRGTNPLFTDQFTAYPHALVDNCTFYITCGHDQAAVGQNGFVMSEWFVLSSTDMVNWTKKVAMNRHLLLGQRQCLGWLHGQGHQRQVLLVRACPAGL